VTRPAFPGGIWAVDFEYHPQGGKAGNPPAPLCMVAREVSSGITHSAWREELSAMPRPPFPTDRSALFLAYNAVAEAACLRALGWTYPANVLDLYAEFRNLTNGVPPPHGSGLLGAARFFGEASISADSKDCMRALILGGGPWTTEERRLILAYCESDVVALARLFARVGRGIDWPRALLRGRFGGTAAPHAASRRRRPEPLLAVPVQFGDRP
jgi:hypothetical protein